MKRRIGIKRRLLEQRQINRRRSVRRNIESVMNRPAAGVYLISSRLPETLTLSLAG